MATAWITIPNEALSVADVPDITAGWAEIAEFALCFDGYRYTGSLEACRALADWIRSEWRDICQLPAHLSELRAALFYEQRRARWTDTDPSGADLRYIRALVAAIALLVREKSA